MRLLSTTALVIFLCASLVGCGSIETYYVMPRSEVETYIERFRSQFKSGDADAETLKALRFFLENKEIFIKMNSDDRFQVDFISRIDPELIARQTYLSDESKRIFGQAKIDRFDDCVYFNDRNWNCGRGQDFDRLRMVNGDLYSDENRLVKKYRVRI